MMRATAIGPYRPAVGLGPYAGVGAVNIGRSLAAGFAKAKQDPAKTDFIDCIGAQYNVDFCKAIYPEAYGPPACPLPHETTGCKGMATTEAGLPPNVPPNGTTNGGGFPDGYQEGEEDVKDLAKMGMGTMVAVAAIGGVALVGGIYFLTRKKK